MTDEVNESTERIRRPRLTPSSLELRRETILDAARGVFAVHGKAARTRDIAKAAGVTEAILYRTFRSKDEIFEAAVLSPMETLALDLMEITVQFASASPQRRLELSQEFQRDVLRVVEEIAPLMGAALLSDDGKRFYATRLMPMVERCAEATGRALLSRSKGALAPRTVFLMLAGMYFGVCLDVLLGEDGKAAEFDRDTVSAQLTDVIAFGLFDPGQRSQPHLTSH